MVLHGNAVAIDDNTCRVVVGKSGAGKSTAAAWHYSQGNKVLADDVCAVSIDDAGAAWVIPSFPQIKLWQASADLLGISTAGLRRIRPEFDKYALPLGEKFQKRSLRLTEIVEIDPEADWNEEHRGVKKLPYLVRHSYRYHFVPQMGILPDYQKKLLQLASSVRLLSVPRRAL